MLVVRLPEPIESRLERLAAKAGRTKTALACEAIAEQIDELEDRYLSEARARRKRKALTMAEVEKKLGLQV